METDALVISVKKPRAAPGLAAVRLKEQEASMPALAPEERRNLQVMPCAVL